MNAVQMCGLALSAALVAMQANGQQVGLDDSAGRGRKMLNTFVTDDAGRLAVLTGVAQAFRDSALENPAQAVRYHFSPDAERKWKMDIASEMIDRQQSDFFTGAIMLPGSQDKGGGIVGLYNPWWDGILLLRLDGNGSADRSEIRVGEFHFLSGETFRGESSSDAVKTLTVVPEKDPLSVELWRVTSATRRAFATAFPDAEPPTWRKCASMLMKLDKRREMERIQARSTLRLQHTLGLMKNARDAGIAEVLTRLVRTGNLYELYKHFREKTARPLLQTFAQMPEMFRKDFAVYGYVPAKNGTLFVLVNKKVPRLYATVSLAPNPTALTSSMEWYDLVQCDELLAAWNGRKEASK